MCLINTNAIHVTDVTYIIIVSASVFHASALPTTKMIKRWIFFKTEIKAYIAVDCFFVVFLLVFLWNYYRYHFGPF